MEGGECKICPDNFYSYSGATNCTACPENTNSTGYHGYCSCPLGHHWDYGAKNCRKCAVGYFMNVTNSTECMKCPENSKSWSGSSKCFCESGFKMITSHSNETMCEICPENHFSSFGSRKCKRCAHFKAAKPGSAHCYRCTLGQYWENHACLQCPDHLFGDGISCHNCPRGFRAQGGFCYRIDDHSKEIKILQIKNSENIKQINWLKIGLIAISGFLVLIFLSRGYAKFCHENGILNEILNSEHTENPLSPTLNNPIQNEIPNGHTAMTETQFTSRLGEIDSNTFDNETCKREASDFSPENDYEEDLTTENPYEEINSNG